MSWPLDPIAAVTHPDPYPYYASLVAQSPWYFDPQLKMWIASGASTVQAIMAHPLCEVRPVEEKIPRVLLHTPAEIIFSHLLRMNEGAEHQKTKARLSSCLATQAEGPIRDQAQRLAAGLWSRRGFEALQFDFSVHVIGHLLGFPDSMLPDLALWIRDFVHCLSPQSHKEEVQAGIRAAGSLLDLFRTCIGQSPLLQVQDHADIDRVAANGIGLLSQAYEATAGLISNSCLALARRPTQDVPARVRETLRLDPPVQNTRRFLAGDAVIAGCALRKGDVILLLLAAANREPSPLFSFGSGTHQCPGESLAVMLAETAIEHLLTLDQSLSSLTRDFSYRPSANTRIALFHQTRGV